MTDTPLTPSSAAPATPPAMASSGPPITAIVVTRGVTRYLAETLAALAAQTRPPARVVVVDAAPRPSIPVPDDVPPLARATLAPLGADLRLATVPKARTFSEAVRGALAELPAPPEGAEPADDRTGWLWLLHDDCAPAPTALAELVRAVEHSPSVAIAGVKQRSWGEPVGLLEVGVTTSRLGRRMTGIEEGEIDQGQHDGREDVLGVGLAGALVRREVWAALGGADPSLGPFGDGLDLCRRARLAGHRVIVVPSAVVRHAQASYRGVRHLDAAAPDAPDTDGDVHRSFGARRRAQVHARLAAVPAVLVPFLGPGYLVAGVLRSLVRVATKEPVLAAAELAAPVAALLHPGRMAQARAGTRRAARLPRRSLRPLQRTARDVFREQRDGHFARTALRRVVQAPSELELAEMAALTRRRRVGFGVLATVLIALTAVTLGDLVTAGLRTGLVVGGALLPAQADLGELWRAATSGWIAGDLGAPGPPDPLLTVLAPLAALTGGAAGAVNLLVLGALLLAGLGAWFAAGAATRSVGARLWAALVWVAAPGLSLALDGGRLGAVVAHVALPWVALGVARAIGVQRRDVVLSGLVGARRARDEEQVDEADARGVDDSDPQAAAETVPAEPGAAAETVPADQARGIEHASLLPVVTGSIGAAAAAGLAFAIAAAGAPVLLLFGLLALLGVAAAAPRRRRRLVLVALPALALLGPTVAQALTTAESGGWRVLFADGGLPLASSAAPTWQQLLAWPVEPSTGGFDWLPAPVAGALPFALGGAVALLALLALGRGAAVARGVRVGWLVTACGLAAAFASGRIETAAGPSVVVRGWPGAGVSLLLLGLLTAAVLGADGLRARMVRHSFGWRQVGVVVLAAVAVLAPLAPLTEWAVRTRTTDAGDPGSPQVLAREGAVVPAVGQQAQTSFDRSRVLALGVDGAGVDYQLLGADGPQLTDLAAAVAARALAGAPGDPSVRPADAASVEVAGVVGRLSAGAAGNVSAELSRLAVAAVLVPPGADGAGSADAGSDGASAAARSFLIGRLDATAGLERITENSSGVIWRVVPDAAGVPVTAGAAWARITTPAAEGATSPSAPIKARRLAVDTRVAAGDPGRLVVLAERAYPGWRASLDGRPLRAVSADWRQTFALGADGGRLTVSYSPPGRAPWMALQAAVGLLTVLLALPVPLRRRGAHP